MVLLLAQTVGFEPTWHCCQIDFESISLRPLRYVCLFSFYRTASHSVWKKCEISMQDNDEKLGTRHPIKPAVMGFPADKMTCRMQTFECSLLRPLEYICIFNFVARNFPQGVISSAPSYDVLGNAPQHKFCTAYYNSLRGKCQFFAGGKMSGGKMSVGCICNERLRFLHDVLQGRQVVQNVAGFQGMIGVLIKTERRAVGAGCGGDGESIAPGVGGA